MPIVIVPPPFQGPTRGVGRVEVEGDTVRAVLERMEAGYPGFAELVWSGDDISRFVKLFRNGEPVEAAALDGSVDADDELEVVAAIAGG